MKPSSPREEAPVSFMSRLRGRSRAEPVPEERFRREVRTVARNLEAIFNTRKGVGCVLPDYGLGDYEGSLAEDGTPEPRMGTKDILAVLVPEIEMQVCRFEPRIEGPNVEVLGRDGMMQVLFAVRGLVSGRSVCFRLALHTVYRNVTITAEGEDLD